MSLGHGASIVRDGLVLHLDAANVKSYPGSGTTWYDLSGNNYHASLLGSNPNPYIANGAVNLEFDTEVYDTDTAGGDLVSVTSTYVANTDAPITYSCWFNQKSANREGKQTSVWLMGPVGTSPTGSGMGFGIGADNSSRHRRIYGISYNETNNQVIIGNLSTGGTEILLDTWYMVSMVHNNTNVTFYINGEFDSTAACSGFAPLSNAFTIGLNRIYYHFGGQISNVTVYNRALSQSEIQQNFNALRGRYGI